jgi:hypothetical protein
MNTDTPRTDAAWVINQADMLDEDGEPWGLASQLECELNEALQLARELRDTLVGIEEYWNRDQNETAMADACWYAINTAQEAIAKANQQLCN